jgi:hypothetical protein
LSGSCQEN